MVLYLISVSRSPEASMLQWPPPLPSTDQMWDPWAPVLLLGWIALHAVLYFMPLGKVWHRWRRDSSHKNETSLIIYQLLCLWRGSRGIRYESCNQNQIQLKSVHSFKHKKTQTKTYILLFWCQPGVHKLQDSSCLWCSILNTYENKAVHELQLWVVDSHYLKQNILLCFGNDLVAHLHLKYVLCLHFNM